MSSKNGFDMLTTRDQNFIAFCEELRAYVEEHHLFPDKHTRLSHKIKYTRKILRLDSTGSPTKAQEPQNEGTLEEWNSLC